jgi:hypothetical protein
MRLGHEKRKVVLLLWALSAFYAVVAILILNSSTLLRNVLITVGGLGWILLLFTFLATQDED